MKKQWTYPMLFMYIYSEPDYAAAELPNLSGADLRVKERLLEQENTSKVGNGLYIHIPFCLKKCKYCRWSTVPWSNQVAEIYLKAIGKEMSMIKGRPYTESTHFESIYIGGGTPSTLSPAQIERLLGDIKGNFQVLPDAEITFEANPATLTKGKMEVLGNLGANRISLGIQTFDEDLLKTMNCTHNVKQAEKAINLVLNSNSILNLDFIYGDRHQTHSIWEKDLKKVSSIGPHQITLYPLRIFPGSSLHEEMTRAEEYDPVEHENRLAAYKDMGNRILTENGYKRGEFAFSYLKEGTPALRYLPIESRALNIGMAAGGFFDNGESLNENNFDKYVELVCRNKLPIRTELPLNKNLIYERFLFYRIVFSEKRSGFKDFVAGRFRKFYGVSMPDKLYDNIISEMEKYGLLEISGDIIRCTPRLWSYIDNAVILY